MGRAVNSRFHPNYARQRDTSAHINSFAITAQPWRITLCTGAIALQISSPFAPGVFINSLIREFSANDSLLLKLRA
jgi:hypothetical protein